MSVLTQHLVRILQCDTRPLTLTANRVHELEQVFKFIHNVKIDIDYDEQTEKYQYILTYFEDDEEKTEVFQSRNRSDALCKLILKTPILHEPMRVKYNQLVYEKYKPKPGRQYRAEALKRQKYETKMRLIQRMKNGIRKYY